LITDLPGRCATAALVFSAVLAFFIRKLFFYHKEIAMFTHSGLLLLVLFLGFGALLRMHVRGAGDGFRRVRASSVREQQFNEIFGQIGEVRNRIAQLKAQFESRSGPAQRWEETVGCHLRYAFDAVKQLNPASALMRYTFAEDAAAALLATLGNELQLGRVVELA
jgi:hypothetical protein